MPARRADTDVVGKDGCVVEVAFDANWRRFSDLDITTAPQSRCLEVQGYQSAQDEPRAIDQDISRIAAHMELDRVARLEARNLEQALWQGLKTNEDPPLVQKALQGQPFEPFKSELAPALVHRWRERLTARAQDRPRRTGPTVALGHTSPGKLPATREQRSG